MLAIRAHFDGTALIPDEPVDLPRDRALIVHVEAQPRPSRQEPPLRPLIVPSDPEAARRLINDSDAGVEQAGPPNASYLRKLNIHLDERSLREIIDDPELGPENF